jgi:5-methylcytosine-specific restriction endonuclease McrBC regulatory subunit McrC
VALIATPSGRSRQTLRAVERRTLALTEDSFRELDKSSAVRALVDQGIVTLVRSRTTPYGLKAGGYVGQALVGPHLRLVVDEKVPGSLLALLHEATVDDVLHSQTASLADLGSPVLEMFARRFLDELATYLRRGRLKEYESQAGSSMLLRGRLDVGRTLRLHSRGHGAALAYRRRKLHADLLTNRLLGLALAAVSGLELAETATIGLATRARSYAALFDDVNWSRLRGRTPTFLAGMFDEAINDRRSRTEIVTLLRYARVLVLSLGAWPADDVGVETPHSFFLNLEKLFEEAVRRSATALCAPRPVVRGRSMKKPLFPDRPGVFEADPDFVVCDGDVAVLVGDAKYKELTNLPGHDDVYQLSAHAHAFGCAIALLVFPGETSATHLVGTTTQGVRVYYSAVRPTHVRDDLAECLRVTGTNVSR